jgi:hypothetical protein
MNQSPDAPTPQSLHVILWALAADPVILAALGYFLKRGGAITPAGDGVSGMLFLIFAIASIGLIYISFGFASGKYDPKTIPPALPAKPGVTRLVGIRIASVGMAAAPAILGFVLYLLSGDDWALLAFNGGALAAAVRHVLAFNSADGK